MEGWDTGQPEWRDGYVLSADHRDGGCVSGNIIWTFRVVYMDGTTKDIGFRNLRKSGDSLAGQKRLSTVDCLELLQMNRSTSRPRQVMAKLCSFLGLDLD